MTPSDTPGLECRGPSSSILSIVPWSATARSNVRAITGIRQRKVVAGFAQKEGKIKKDISCPAEAAEVEDVKRRQRQLDADWLAAWVGAPSEGSEHAAQRTPPGWLVQAGG